MVHKALNDDSGVCMKSACVEVPRFLNIDTEHFLADGKNKPHTFSQKRTLKIVSIKSLHKGHDAEKIHSLL